MTFLIQDFKNIVVVGLGKTGVSCAVFLNQLNIPFSVNDSRKTPPGLETVSAILPPSRIFLGGFDKQLLLSADLIILSQGVSLKEPIICEAYQRNIYFINDVDLFTTYAKAPIIAITGSNAKSTVTTLVGEILKKAGLSVEVGGNLGTPLLTLLTRPTPQYYVVELSNFQLELTHNLEAKIATILNISPDHMDRYDTYEDYIRAKQHIYVGCEMAVYNADDPSTYLLHGPHMRSVAFGMCKDAIFTLMEDQHEWFLAKDKKPFMPATLMKQKGRHNWLNGLAAATITSQLGVSLSVITQVLTDFSGLPHRCEWVAEKNGVTWVNDSKGTNVGATMAAIEGLGTISSGKIVLIAGGQGKGADFKTLVPVVKAYVKQVVLIGEDADLLKQALSPYVSCEKVGDLSLAISTAHTAAKSGDIVLFSPACASFDMFNNFEHRGGLFRVYVKELLAYETAGSYDAPENGS